jgi:DNA-binding MarR family transcriptional regulator
MATTSESDAGTRRRQAAEAALSSLGQTVGSLRCAGSQRLVRLGVSMTHFHVLTLLRHHDAMPMGRLAEILDASMSSTTGIIDRMEERGLVERVRVPDDRRLVLVQPSPRGLELVDEAELVKSDVMAGAIARLAPDEIERLTVATSVLRRAITEELEANPDYASLAQCDHPGLHARATHRAAPGADPALPATPTARPASPSAGPAGV